MLFNLIIYSKNKRSILKFFKNFEKICKNNKIKIFYKLYKSNKKQKKIVILKSPHVNKTAQESFKIKTFFKSIYVYSNTPFKFLTFLKKYQNFLLFDIYLKTKVLVKKNKLKKNINFFYNVTKNIKLKNSYFKPITKKILKNFDILGELKLKSLDSSVG